jgi:hypothetical protein
MNTPKPTFLLALLAFAACHQPGQNKETIPAVSAPAFIRPPLPGADVPFKEYTVAAEKGDTIFYPSGSILLFPPNAFVDKAGNIIAGKVDITYRELSSPIDYFLSGIPMTYDSSGKNYVFQSSGMCEIKAFKNGIPVFVNPGSKPEIYLAGQGREVIDRLYFLDTVQKRWVNKGAAMVANLQQLKNSEKKVAAKTSAIPRPVSVAPLRPVKASGDKPEIVIRIAPGSFEELMAYNNMKFELQDAEKSWSPKDADEEWSDIKLERTGQQGLYSIRFSNKNKTVTYKTKPVLEGKDYDDAMKLFETKQKEYEQSLGSRLKKDSLVKKKQAKAMEDQAKEEQQIREDNIRTLAENERINKLNALIEARNKIIEARNKQILAQNRWVEDANKATDIINSFQLSGFGIWNCDRPEDMIMTQVQPRFTDSTGKEIKLENIAVVVKKVNAIFQFTNIIRLAPGADNMIWGTTEGKFAYVSYEAYRNLHIDAGTKEQTFKLTILPAGQNKYETIKAIVDGL